MLVLSRRPGERIRVGKDIWITVIEVRHGGGKVWIGVDAPPDVSIWREEL